MDCAALIAQLQNIAADPSAVDAAHRQRLKDLTRQVSVALEEPFETVQRLAYSPLPLVSARIAQQHGVYSALTGASGSVPFETLLKESGLPAGVLESLLDYLCTQQMASEPSVGNYQATKLSHMLMVPLFQDAITHFHDNCLPAVGALDKVLTTPTSKTAFEVGQHSDVDFYTWLESHPLQKQAFHKFMEAQFASLPTWLDAVDFSTLATGLKDDQIAFVDVGGGAGQQCKLLSDKFPEVTGIVLQDKKEVLDLASVQTTKMEYDYLTEQPVKNARVYYFRQIMHNNDDETCIKILKAQIPAMDADSVIVIDDKCLPDEKPKDDSGSEYTAALSIMMMAMFNAQERKEKHWRALISQAGLVIKDIKKFSQFNDSAIIVQLA